MNFRLIANTTKDFITNQLSVDYIILQILPWQYYQAEFIVEENFKEFILPIEDFKKSGSLMLKKVNPKKITSIGLVAYGRNHEAELTIKEIEFIN